MPAATIAIGLQALGMGADIIGGIRARKIQREADRQAQEALDQAKQRIEVNRLEGLQVPLDAYEQAMRENTAQQMQALQGLREADPRALAAGVGRLTAAGASATETDRQRMQADIYKRDQAIALEEANIDRMLANISLQEAAGAQQAAADMEQMAAQQFSGAIKGAGNIASSIYGMSDLYGSRKTELDAARALQEQGMYEGMNERQARREMLRSGGYNPQEISNLASFGSVYGKGGGAFDPSNPFSLNAYFSPMRTNLQPLTFPTFETAIPQSRGIDFIPPSLQNK